MILVTNTISFYVALRALIKKKIAIQNMLETALYAKIFDRALVTMLK